MKKIISLIFILFLVGCSNDYITCNIEVNNNIQDYNMTGVYKIHYKGNYVTKIEEQEKYVSPNETTLNYFDESKSLDYYNLNDLYGGYTYTISKSDESVNFSSIIDMSVVNIKEMVKDRRIDKDYVISNKLTTSGIVRIYESKGAICDI